MNSIPKPGNPGSIQQTVAYQAQNIQPVRLEVTSSSQVLPPTSLVHSQAITPAQIQTMSASGTAMMGGYEIITILTQAGCPDITNVLNTSETSNVALTGGGFCDVFRGQLSGNRVAIKRLRLFVTYSSDDTKALKKAARELSSWSQLSHSNILELHGICRFRGNVALVCPWMEGGNLLQYLERNPAADRFHLCSQVASGMAYIHQSQLIHGDLKAANVLVSSAGVAKIDYVGISGFKNDISRGAGTSNPLASIRWTAPEVMKATEPQGPASDVWSLGMTVLELITGQEPFAGKPEPLVIMDVMIRQMTPPRPNASILPHNEQGDGLWELLMKCWSPDPSSRPSANQVYSIMLTNGQKGLNKGGNNTA